MCWPGLRPCRPCVFRCSVITAQSEPPAALRLLGMLYLRLDAVGEILPTLERSDVRGIPVEVRPSDAEFFFVGVDPFPQLVAGRQALGPRLALDAHDICS